MTIQELRQPMLNHIGSILKLHQDSGKCGVNDLGGIMWGKCNCTPHRMFLYDIIHHEPHAEELKALETGITPDFLDPAKGDWKLE